MKIFFWTAIARASTAAWILVLVSGCSAGSAASQDAAATAFTCQEIRTCVWYCPSATSQPCVNDCIARGSPAAQSIFQVLAACSATPCANADQSAYSYCVNCEQRCFADAQCVAETQACAGSGPDVVCDNLCR
jgi:hypothetical protein